MAEVRPNSNGKPAENEPKPQPRVLKSGAPAHQFTREDAIKGGKRSAEVRKERAKSHGQRLRDTIEKQERAIFDAMIQKAKEGSTQAAALVWSYAYGLPAKVEPDEIDMNVTSAEGARGVALADVLELAKKTGVDVSQSPAERKTA